MGVIRNMLPIHQCDGARSQHCAPNPVNKGGRKQEGLKHPLIAVNLINFNMSSIPIRMFQELGGVVAAHSAKTPAMVRQLQFEAPPIPNFALGRPLPYPQVRDTWPSAAQIGFRRSFDSAEAYWCTMKA